MGTKPSVLTLFQLCPSPSPINDHQHISASDELGYTAVCFVFHESDSTADDFSRTVTNLLEKRYSQALEEKKRLICLTALLQVVARYFLGVAASISVS